MRVLYATVLFIVLITLLFVTRPLFAFDEDGQILSFGRDTAFSVGVMTCVFAIVSFYIFAMMDLVKQKPT